MAQEIIFTSLSKIELADAIREVIKAELLDYSSGSKIQEDELLTENDAKKLLLVSKVTLKKWRDEGRIKFHRIGSRIRYKRSEILEALESTPSRLQKTIK